MTREDLFAAIGQVEEDRLARCDDQEPSNITHLEGNDMENNTKKRPLGRIMRNLLVAAVMAALLATTVLAGTAYREVFGDVTETEEMYTPTDAYGNSHSITSHKIELDIQLNDDAPAEIETYFVPEMPEEYTQTFGYAYYGTGKVGVVTMMWDVPGGEKTDVLFYQITKEGFEKSYKYAYAGGKTEGSIQMSQAELGGVDGFLILAPEESKYGRKHFYWSDGDYLFYMRFTYDFTQEQMARIIAGVRQVEDVEPYLISMSEDEMKQAFEN